MKHFRLPVQICDLVDKLSLEEQGAVYAALFAYVFRGEDRSAGLGGLALSIYNVSLLAAKPQLDRARRRERQKAGSKAAADNAASAATEKQPEKTSADVAVAKKAPWYESDPTYLKEFDNYGHFRPVDLDDEPSDSRLFSYDEGCGGRLYMRQETFAELPCKLYREAVARGWGHRDSRPV